MGFQSRSERAEAVPADERAQEIDAIGRVNLPLDRRADRGFATGVHQQVGGRQRNQGLGRGAWKRGAPGECPDFTQNSQRNDQRVVGRDRIGALLVPQPCQQRVADFCLLREPFVLGHGAQGALEQATQVLGDGDVRIDRLRGSDIGATRLKPRKEPLKLDCEKLLVQPANRFGHKAPGQIWVTGWKPQPRSDGDVKLHRRIFEQTSRRFSNAKNTTGPRKWLPAFRPHPVSAFP
jgi:hypothetical protein